MSLELICSLLEAVSSINSSTEDISNASKTLKNCFLQVQSIPSLIQIISRHESQGVRQLASVEVRKLIRRDDGTFWETLDSTTRDEIKTGILAMAISEPTLLVRHSLAHVISEVAKNELMNDRWSGLVTTLYEACLHTSVAHREIAIYVLYSLFEVIADKMESYIPQLLGLFGKMINDESLVVGVTTAQALGKVADFIEENDAAAIKEFRNLIPHIVAVLQKCLAAGDDEGAGKIFQVFDSLLLLEVPLLSKHFVELITLFLTIGESVEVEEDIRVQALSFLMWSIMSAKSKIQKANLIPVMITSMFKIAAEEESDQRDDDYPARLAIQLINTLATTFAPNQVFPVASQLAYQSLQSSKSGDRKAAMLAIAVLVGGCADYMRPQIHSVIELVSLGLLDSEREVIRAACMALGALCDDFEEEITSHHAKLVPLLFGLITELNESILTEVLSTLDVLVENLGSLVEVYVAGLMDKLLLLWSSSSRKVQITTTNCIGSVAFSASDAFIPYAGPVLDQLCLFMTLKEKDDLGLRSVSTDCIGAVATAVGSTLFDPYLTRVMELAVHGMQLDNSSLNQCSYVLFGNLARLYGNNFAPFLHIIVPSILNSCLGKEEFGGLEEIHIGEEDEEKPAFASGVAQEKESSIDTLGDLFASTKSAFMPYLPDSINMALNLLDHYHDSVRITAAGALFKFFNTAYLMVNHAEWEPGLPLKTSMNENVANIGKLAIEGVILMLDDEEDRMVVTQCLQLLAETLKITGPSALSQQFNETKSHLDAIANLLLQILSNRHPCQLVEDSPEEFDDDVAELDSLVISAAADTVSVMAAALSMQFELYFTKFYPLIANYYKSSKPLSERSMAIGALAESADGLEAAVTPFTGDLLELFLRALNDDEDEVRSNAAFGAGVVCTHTKADIRPYYPRLLQLLHPLFKESHTNIRDNACGALCRMIIVAPECIPLDQAVTLILDSLPLTKDFEENRPIYKALLNLLYAGNPLLISHLDRVFTIFAQVLQAKQLHSTTQAALIEFWMKMKDLDTAQFGLILSKLSPNTATFITSLI